MSHSLLFLKVDLLSCRRTASFVFLLGVTKNRRLFSILPDWIFLPGSSEKRGLPEGAAVVFDVAGGVDVYKRCKLEYPNIYVKLVTVAIAWPWWFWYPGSVCD
jgi:hypothetical protein